PAGDFDAIDGIDSSDAPNASDTPAQAAARRTRAQNRAAKRAASGVRPKAVRGGPVRGRSSSNTGLILLAIAAVVVGVGVFALGNPFGSPGASPTPSAAASGSPYGDGTCPTSQPPALGTSEVKYVSIETEKGTMVLKIDGSLSPIAAGNFVALAECGYYNGIGFHRTPLLTSGTPFVIQGGDPAGDGTGGPGYTIEDEEVTADYVRGTVAMARTSQPNSQGSQFFIVLSDEAGEILKSANTYAIFGTVVQGMEVADAIFAASNGVELPADPVVMTKVTVSDTEPAPAPTTAPSAGPTTAPSDAPSEAPTPAPSGG
ncbi:MAG TPA: peptidylprolyl isomerase, partial [Candidatus Binatia bacterium]|nr:peptidylprolyl isomerase [Candidatus Binatia bacterium]